MTINQIECFVETIKSGSISKAADNLFITQQAVSTQIKSMEKELGFKILERSNKGVSATAEGSILIEPWELILEKYNFSVDKANDIHDKKSHSLRVGIEDMGKCSEDCMAAFAEFEKRYTGLNILFQIMNPREMRNQLQDDDLDMAILYASEFQKDTSFKKLLLLESNMRVRLYISKNHPLAVRNSLSLETVKDEVVGCLDEKYSMDCLDQIRRFFEHNSVPCPEKIRMFSSRREFEISLIAGQCVAVVYEEMFYDKHNQLISVEIDAGNMSSNIAIFWKKDEINTKARYLQKILKEKLSRLNSPEQLIVK